MILLTLMAPMSLNMNKNISKMRTFAIAAREACALHNDDFLGKFQTALDPRNLFSPKNYQFDALTKLLLDSDALTKTVFQRFRL